MIVRLHHPDNGWTHAYTQSELEQLKANGWREDKPAEQKPALVLPVLDAPPKRPTLKVKR
jgi:hypothetical protein